MSPACCALRGPAHVDPASLSIAEDWIVSFLSMCVSWQRASSNACRSPPSGCVPGGTPLAFLMGARLLYVLFSSSVLRLARVDRRLVQLCHLHWTSSSCTTTAGASGLATFAPCGMHQTLCSLTTLTAASLTVVHTPRICLLTVRRNGHCAGSTIRTSCCAWGGGGNGCGHSDSRGRAAIEGRPHVSRGCAGSAIRTSRCAWGGGGNGREHNDSRGRAAIGTGRPHVSRGCAGFGTGPRACWRRSRRRRGQGEGGKCRGVCILCVRSHTSRARSMPKSIMALTGSAGVPAR